MDFNVHIADLHIHLHAESLGPSAHQKLDSILRAVAAVAAQEHTIMTELEDLQKQVAETDTAEASALVLINGIAARLAAAGTDPAALSALTADLKGNSDRLAAAVIANTPTTAAEPPAATTPV